MLPKDITVGIKHVASKVFCNMYCLLSLKNLQIEKIHMPPTIRRITTSEFQLGFILAK